MWFVDDEKFNKISIYFRNQKFYFKYNQTITVFEFVQGNKLIKGKFRCEI